MAKGASYPDEGLRRTDPATGVTVRQITAHASIHHHPFFYLPAYDDAMRWLVFVSHRSGVPAVFVEERAEGRLLQLTDRPDLNEWSIHPSHDGRHVYFTAGAGAWRVEIPTGREELLATLSDAPLLPPGMVGDAMGTTSLSRDDRWWAVPVRHGPVARLHVIDTTNGAVACAAEAPTIMHPQFHPADDTWLHYGGSFRERLQVVRRDGSGGRLAYVRDAVRKQWIVHEVWHPRRLELLAVDWPHGMIAVDVASGATRRVCDFPAWHAAPSRDGRRMVCDTNRPDRGLMLFDPDDGVGAPKLLCASRASNAGAHWQNDHCPYDDGPVAVVAPQHTHPHPSFSPDGRFVVFTSDVSGVAQVYEAALPLSPP